MHRSLIVVAIVGMVAAPCARAAVEPAVTEAVDDHARQQQASELLAQGDAHHAAGRHVEAARAYAAAFDALTEQERSDVDERLAINLALDELTLAQAMDPEDLDLLEEEVALLERYRARKGTLSTGLAKELVRAQGRVEELRPKEETTLESAASEDNGPEATLECGDGLQVAQDPLTRRAICQPVPRPRPWPPRSSVPAAPPTGKGLRIAGITVTSAVGAARLIAFLTAASSVASTRAFVANGSTIALIYGSLGAGLGLTLLGRGSVRRGEWLAHRRVFQATGFTPRSRRGWALFGGGMGLWLVTGSVGLYLLTDSKDLASFFVLELGWLASIPMIASGLAIGLEGRSYRRHRRLFEPYRRASTWRPVIGLAPGGGTLMLSGRL